VAVEAYRIAARLHKENAFDIAHHVSWGSLQMGSFMYRLKIPFIFGPAGGGQTAPAAFKRYFGAAWATEENRDRASRLLLKFNPSCRSMLEKATAVLASNGDTARIAKANGGSNISLALDAGLPRWFFPETNVAKLPQADTLKLLWVGRFMPRKGTLLLLDTMKALNEYPGITLTLVGDGPTRDEFLETVKTYQLEDTVHWNGRVPWGEVRGYYADHDVFLFTSLRDSCPMQVVEAMAFGMPVVTLDLHGQGVIVDVDRGFKCSCDTPDVAIESLKLAILDLYNNAALFNRLRSGAVKFAANQAWDKKIDSIVERFYP